MRPNAPKTGIRRANTVVDVSTKKVRVKASPDGLRHCAACCGLCDPAILFLAFFWFFILLQSQEPWSIFKLCQSIIKL